MFSSDLFVAVGLRAESRVAETLGPLPPPRHSFPPPPSPPSAPPPSPPRSLPPPHHPRAAPPLLPLAPPLSPVSRSPHSLARALVPHADPVLLFFFCWPPSSVTFIPPQKTQAFGLGPGPRFSASVVRRLLALHLLVLASFYLALRPSPPRPARSCVTLIVYPDRTSEHAC